jgi:uncharacterized protein
LKNWSERQVTNVQYGVGERGPKSPVTGEPVAGPETLPETTLAANRANVAGEALARRLVDDYYRARTPVFAEIDVPLLSAANWGGQGLHPRGNFEAFMNAASEQKWLEVHGDSHWSLFYTDYGLHLQKRFFEHFLKHVDNGWDEQPRVHLNIRHVDGSFAPRDESAWPLAQTEWIRYHLDSEDMALTTKPIPTAGSVAYEALGDGVTFLTPPLNDDIEITGPIAAKLFVSSSSQDADVFLIVRVFRANGDEVVFQGALDPNTPIAQGWLRASHRRLDLARSLPYRPYHSHDRVDPLTPGEVYEVDIEIWPTSIVVPLGCRVALTIRGKDYEYGGELSEFAKSFYYASKGCGPFTHNDPEDRPREIFGGTVTVFTGGATASYLLLPIIPEVAV